MACYGNGPLIDYVVSNDDRSIEAASPCGWPNNFSCHLPVFAADLVDNEDSPVAETLINAAAGHKMMSFMDGNAGYN